MLPARACRAPCAVLFVALIGIYFAEEAIMSGGTLYRNTVWLARGVNLYTRYPIHGQTVLLADTSDKL